MTFLIAGGGIRKVRTRASNQGNIETTEKFYHQGRRHLEDARKTEKQIRGRGEKGEDK